MSEAVIEAADDAAPPENDGELVHWMEPKPIGLPAAAGVAFTLGVLATVAVLALTNWLGPERVFEIRRRRHRF